MIAFFVSSPARLALMARLLHLPTREVDGGWRFLESEVGGALFRAYEVQFGADDAYAVTRLAARRGAKVMIPLLETTTTERIADREGLTPGAVMAAGDVWDLAGLGLLMRLMPDGASALPLDVADLLPKTPAWRAPEVGPAVGTLSELQGSRSLAAELDRRLHILLSDRQASGFAQAAADSKTEFRPLAHLSRVLAKGRSWEASSDEALAEQLDGLVRSAAR